jgi:hypothetical protein
VDRVQQSTLAGRARRHPLPALERAIKALLVEKRQALLNVVCDVDTNAGGD